MARWVKWASCKDWMPPARPRLNGYHPVFSSRIKNINSAGITKMVNTVETARPPSITLPSPLESWETLLTG